MGKTYKRHRKGGDAPFRQDDNQISMPINTNVINSCETERATITILQNKVDALNTQLTRLETNSEKERSDYETMIQELKSTINKLNDDMNEK